ncbi:hypothetical protein GQ53DRAFT_805146 [Thozetella sp. PMI_491]|nr:hypothetical protein GQ53DRAFT_805146 [Thozetella sp. PMI_491]
MMGHPCYFVTTPNPHNSRGYKNIDGSQYHFYVKFGENEEKAAYEEANPTVLYSENNTSPKPKNFANNRLGLLIEMGIGECLESNMIKRIGNGVPDSGWCRLVVEEGQDQDKLRIGLISLHEKFATFDWSIKHDWDPSSSEEPCCELCKTAKDTWGASKGVARFQPS